MLKIHKFVTLSPEQWEIVIEGARNPMNSWDRMDSHYGFEFPENLAGAYYDVGPNDQKLLESLAKGGPVHAKYRRMMPVWVTLTAPLYWWKEFDTYKVGTVANSCSTMHKIHAKEFELFDFSFERLIGKIDDNWDIAAGPECRSTPLDILEDTVHALNVYREKFLETKEKKYWEQMIQLLPSSYNQKRTVMLNYEVLVGIYRDRKNHKLDEWYVFCDWIRELPYSELITGEEEKCKTESEYALYPTADMFKNEENSDG